jgi:hypothetical protein
MRTPPLSKEDFSNVEAYATQLGWYQLFSKKGKGESKNLGSTNIGNECIH